MNLLAGVDFRWELDGLVILAGTLAAMANGLLGNFLVLRKMSLLGDAISHAILPGLALAFLLTSSRSSLWMLVGAVVVGVVTAMLTEWIRSVGNVDEGASMGVVFTTLFALGLVMIVQAADQVDLDPGCVLYGAIELIPLDCWNLFGLQIPRVVLILGGVAVLDGLFVLLFYKELKLSSFDPALCTTLGFSSRLMHYLLMTLVSVTAIASFESVGSILVVAMLVVPPSAAYLLTDRLAAMIAMTAIFGFLSAVLGHFSAILIPQWFGFHSTSTAGMMAVMAGMLFALTLLFGPRHGVVMNYLRRQQLAGRIVREDLLGFLYRMEERNDLSPSTPQFLAERILEKRWRVAFILRRLSARGMVVRRGDGYGLTDRGRDAARQLVRSHRLWEYYLLQQAGLREERIHDSAERLEHYTGAELNQRLSDQTDSPRLDPHGSPIPGLEEKPQGSDSREGKEFPAEESAKAP